MKTAFVMPRKAITRLLVPALVVFSSACDYHEIINNDDASGDFTASDSFLFEIQAAGQSVFRIEGVNGPIKIVGVPVTETARIWGERRVTSKSAQDAHEYLNEIEIRVIDGNDEVFVETVQPEDTHGRNVEVVYHVNLPDHWVAVVENGNGNISVDSLRQKVTVNSANGNIRLQQLGGGTSVRLVNGNVTLQKVFGSSSVALVNGNVNAVLMPPPRALCELSTINGTLGLHIPRKTSADFSATVAHGVISMVNLDLQNATTSPSSMSGRLGEGSGRIALKTINGNIHVAGF